jgi:WW domain-containing oxidoreductase
VRFVGVSSQGLTPFCSRSKLAQACLIIALKRRKDSGRLGANAPYFIATMPGAVSTDQQNQLIDAYGAVGKAAQPVIRPLMKDPETQGCRAILFAATADEVVSEGIDGAYVRFSGLSMSRLHWL